jgi:hypothetical protein
MSDYAVRAVERHAQKNGIDLFKVVAGGGIGHLSPQLHFKYALFHWGIKHNQLNST